MDYKKELDELVSIVVKEGASDLHISEGRNPTIRSAGYLIPMVKRSIYSREDTYGIIDELLSEENKGILNKKREVDFAYMHIGRARFRGNAYFQQGNISVALRLVPEKIKTIKELGMPPILESIAHKTQGFFLVVGPTGQGKSTTLASMIELINTERMEHIITIEDPVEYVYKQKKCIIDQREIRSDTPDFYVALRGVFRQDVDVVMIGEMREPETISTAVTAAETGHFVLSTLHTNSAAQTIDRIIDSFPGQQQNQIKLQLAGSLIGILSQRLIPKISGGLVPAIELLLSNNAVANLIREGRTHEINTVIQTSSDMGMIDLNRSLAELVRNGDITIENAFLHSQNPKVLERMI